MIRSVRFASGTLICILAGLTAADCRAADDVAQGIEVLLSVGPEGKGHREAQAAWRVVSKAPAGSLPELLAALDKASPLAANWLRSAVETIADGVPAGEQKAVAAQLEQFVAEVAHVPTARRLAYDILIRFDATAADRLMPGFLNDPSTELRRESIERLLAQAATAKDEATSKQLQRQAFEAARDLDQIKTLAEKLEKLGEPVDLPTHFGFVMQWKLIGPFDNAGEKGFDVAYPPETEINPSAKYPGKEGKEVGWIDHTTTDKHGVVDLNAALGKSKGAAAYAYAVFRAAKSGPVDIRIGSNNAVKVWINGKLCDSRRVYHSGFAIDQYTSRAELAAGENRILVKVCENEQTESWAQDWNFQLRVCDAVGTAVLSADRVAGK